MTRREIVERNITFNNPPRIAMKFDVVGVNDCYDVWTVDPTGWTWEFQGRTADEFGCVWERTEVANTGQVVGHPLADLAKLREYRWPDPDDSRRYLGFVEQLRGAEDRFVMFCFGHGVFERLHMLLGMSQSLMAFYKHPREVHEIIERILDHHLRVFRNCVRIAENLALEEGTGRDSRVSGCEKGLSHQRERRDARTTAAGTAEDGRDARTTAARATGGIIHGAAMADDWGLQDRAFINTKVFREFYKPVYKRWFDEIKAAGVHTWMHSCGRINDIVEELIDCGLEVINNQQPNTVVIDDFGRRYRSRICFEAIVDTQSTLPRGTYDEIRAQAHELVEKYGTPRGGFIASDYNDAEAIGVTTDRRLVMFEAFAEAGGYPGFKEILERVTQPLVGHSYGRRAMGLSHVRSQK